MIDAALEYLSQGFSVIPINPVIDKKTGKAKKKPFISWAEFQTRRPSEDEIKEWWGKWPHAMIGIVTGKISSDLCVIDFDSYKEDFDPELAEELVPDNIITPTANTPSGGVHLYFKLPAEQIELGGDNATFPGIDLRANGNYIIAPPSANGNGKKYAWVPDLSLFDISLASLPLPYIKRLETIKGGF